MTMASPNNTSSEPAEHIIEQDVGGLSEDQLRILAKSFAIFIASKGQPLDLNYYMQKMEDIGPRLFLEYIREELHDHMNIGPISDSGDNYGENLAEDAKLFERILTCKGAKTTPAAYTDEGSCDVPDEVLLHRFGEIWSQNLDPVNTLANDRKPVLAVTLGYASGRRGEYPELSSSKAIPRALLGTLGKCQSESQVPGEINPWHPCPPPSKLPNPTHVQVVPGAKNVPPPPQPNMASRPGMFTASGTSSASWNIASSIFTASGSLQLRPANLSGEFGFKVAVILLLVCQSLKLHS
ncbi:hypothetical protein F53441_1858 [Fusarium austroafricanum]|uniref:Uncharacterized protein n=1 Tax=Fusarium austroafricanum TaxID=2364996 RepID=A0A8H4KR41_9HYPO|nr:hypothetical protein F53441_1858 [Fusarium austroafricanum]